jgi:hypothetical protein
MSSCTVCRGLGEQYRSDRLSSEHVQFYQVVSIVASRIVSYCIASQISDELTCDPILRVAFQQCLLQHFGFQYRLPDQQLDRGRRRDRQTARLRECSGEAHLSLVKEPCKLIAPVGQTKNYNWANPELTNYTWEVVPESIYGSETLEAKFGQVTGQTV